MRTDPMVSPRAPHISFGSLLVLPRFYIGYFWLCLALCIMFRYGPAVVPLHRAHGFSFLLALCRGVVRFAWFCHGSAWVPPLFCLGPPPIPESQKRPAKTFSQSVRVLAGWFCPGSALRAHNPLGAMRRREQNERGRGNCGNAGALPS